MALEVPTRWRFIYPGASTYDIHIELGWGGGVKKYLKFADKQYIIFADRGEGIKNIWTLHMKEPSLKDGTRCAITYKIKFAKYLIQVYI